jgi:Carboxypeptidase regulatory-like domain
MKRHLVLFLALAMIGLTAASYAEKEKGDSGRLLLGRVLDQSDNPVSGAIVYLSNTRTQTVKTYIVSQDGNYRFPALSPNIDYEVYAQYKGRKSDTKTVSQFDNRQQVNIVLKIDVR